MDRGAIRQRRLKLGKVIETPKTPGN
jgi:hypothetical protein